MPPGPQSYTVTTAKVGSGSVTLDPQKATYNMGDAITLTANPEPGWHFVAWSGDYTGATTPVGLTVQTDLVVTATFALDGSALHLLNVKIEGAGGGIVTRSPQKDQYDTGERVQLTAQSFADSYFVGWSGALSGMANPATITMDGDREVIATFAQGAGVNVQSGDGGTVATSPAPPYAPGQQVTITATPNANYMFTGWLIDGLPEAGGQGSTANPVRVIIVPDSKVYKAQFALSNPGNLVNKIFMPVVMK